jgi:hypothetical protein
MCRERGRARPRRRSSAGSWLADRSRRRRTGRPKSEDRVRTAPAPPFPNSKWCAAASGSRARRLHVPGQTTSRHFAVHPRRRHGPSRRRNIRRRSAPPLPRESARPGRTAVRAGRRPTTRAPARAAVDPLPTLRAHSSGTPVRCRTMGGEILFSCLKSTFGSQFTHPANAGTFSPFGGLVPSN